MNLGIDLGTTFSLASFVNAQGVPVLVPDFHNANEFRTPSAVHVTDKQALVGAAIEELLLEEPALRVARGFKQLMGGEAPAWRDGEGRDWPAEALSALVLKKLLRDVEAFAVESVDNCVVTVPANFDDAPRRATQLAARLAGLSRVHLVEEPVAAATFYGFSEKSSEQTLFVYDFGGGTFDATVLQISEGKMFVLATEGRNGLGGRCIDSALVDLIARDFVQQHGRNPMDDVSTHEQLRHFAEEAKIALGMPARSRLRKTLVLAGHVVELALSREQLDRIVLPIVDETVVVARRCLDAAGLTWNQIDRVLMTGGSSLLPAVGKRLVQETGKLGDSLHCRQPHQAVAYGAALIAEARATRPDAQPLSSVAPYHLGLRVRDTNSGSGRIETLIKRNTPLPARHTATFYTNRPEQTRIVLDVVQGKGEGELVASLGHFAFGPIKRPKKNYPVEVTLAYDTEGLVKVTAKDVVTGEALERDLTSSDNPDLARFSNARGLLHGVDVNQ